MLTLEYIAEQKTKYQESAEYYQKLGFDRLASDYKNMVVVLNSMEDYLKENLQTTTGENDDVSQ